MTYSSNHTNHNGQGELPLEHFVTAVTDAVITRKEGLQNWADQFGISHTEAAEWITFIRQLSNTLVLVKPNKTYSSNLKRELIGQADRTMVERVRQLPPRVQIAATLAVAAGVWILARRRAGALASAVKEAAEDGAEVAIAQ